MVRGARIVFRLPAPGWLENQIRNAGSLGPSVQGVERRIREATKSGRTCVLAQALEEITRDLGFRFYFLGSHNGCELSNLGDLPEQLVMPFRDFLRRIAAASENIAHGFLWSETLPTLTRVNDETDHASILAGAGWGDGFTVPVHVPGRRPALFSFITTRGNRPLRANLPMAQFAATAGFDALHEIHARGAQTQDTAVGIPQLTMRQRECILLAAKGKSDTQAAKLLGISSDTIHQHLEAAKHRYGVATRAELIVRVLFDGQIPFEAVLRN